MNREELQKLAESGDTEAQINLGLDFLKRNTFGNRDSLGTPDENEYTQGIAWLEKAANAGSAKAQKYLGIIYSGISVKCKWNIWKKDKEKSIYWDTQAAQQGDKEAAFSLALIYREKNTDEDFEKAVYWYKQSEYYYELGKYIDEQAENKEENPTNMYKEATKYYQKAFENEDPGFDEEEYIENCKELISQADFYYQYGNHIEHLDGGKVKIDIDRQTQKSAEAIEIYEIVQERFRIAGISLPSYNKHLKTQIQKLKDIIAENKKI